MFTINFGTAGSLVPKDEQQERLAKVFEDILKPRMPTLIFGQELADKDAATTTLFNIGSHLGGRWQVKHARAEKKTCFPAVFYRDDWEKIDGATHLVFPSSGMERNEHNNELFGILIKRVEMVMLRVPSTFSHTPRAGDRGNVLDGSFIRMLPVDAIDKAKLRVLAISAHLPHKKILDKDYVKKKELMGLFLRTMCHHATVNSDFVVSGGDFNLDAALVQECVNLLPDRLRSQIEVNLVVFARKPITELLTPRRPNQNSQCPCSLLCSCASPRCSRAGG